MTKLCIADKVETTTLQALLDFPRHLKTLSMKEIFYNCLESEGIPIEIALHSFLSNHANTLEYLSLGFSSVMSKIVWNIPRLPNVKRFQLYVPTEFDLAFDPKNTNQNLNYTATFPQLKDLSIVFIGRWPWRWLRFFNTLFPREGVCGTVTQFEIREQCDRVEISRGLSKICKICESAVDIDVRFGRILKIFPYADNKFWKELRGYFAKMESL